MTDTRLCAKGQITDLQKGFRLPNGTPFSIFLRPISGNGESETAVASDTVIQCKLICDVSIGPFPVHVGDWTPGKIAYLPPYAIDTDKYEIYWGASDNPN